ncbi:hypothetical protein [Polluticaenibacter yanchengensis]|uniref:Uncharacterized protein n=1 Tax=Polluticaenibacter yanchengensis TaxID=3014562 RepID=A0ABT4UIU6_9BACT|nr:hypothetical protein [Chitinophagaceae bacterium LY-5]
MDSLIPINDYVIIKPFPKVQHTKNGIEMPIDSYVKSEVISGNGFKSGDEVVFTHSHVIESDSILFINSKYILQ